MKAWEAHDLLEVEIMGATAKGSGDKDIVVITKDGQTHPITSVHYNKSLDVYVISTWEQK